jgi:toxin ParE1/3/4
VKPFGFGPEAREEYQAAIEHYESVREGLGLEFQEVVEEAVRLIQSTPKLHSKYKNTEYRKCVLRRFQYNLFYAELEGRIWIAAVAHQRRRPDYWMSRTPT